MFSSCCQNFLPQAVPVLLLADELQIFSMSEVKYGTWLAVIHPPNRQSVPHMLETTATVTGTLSVCTQAFQAIFAHPLSPQTTTTTEYHLMNKQAKEVPEQIK